MPLQAAEAKNQAIIDQWKNAFRDECKGQEPGATLHVSYAPDVCISVFEIYNLHLHAGECVTSFLELFVSPIL